MIERKYVVNQEFVDELKWILDRLIDEEYDITKIYGDRKLIERVYSMVSDLRKA